MSAILLATWIYFSFCLYLCLFFNLSYEFFYNFYIGLFLYWWLLYLLLNMNFFTCCINYIWPIFQLFYSGLWYWCQNILNLRLLSFIWSFQFFSTWKLFIFFPADTFFYLMPIVFVNFIFVRVHLRPLLSTFRLRVLSGTTFENKKEYKFLNSTWT